MIQLLQLILCAIQQIAALVGWFVVTIINLVIAAIGALAAVLVALLPSMPSEPSAPTGGILGFVNWVVPLGPLVGGLAVAVILWLGFLAIKIALRWVKAL